MGIVPYKGLNVLSPAPIGSGGALIQGDLMALADRIGPCNLTATRNPATTDDVNAGYFPNSQWINTLTNTWFTCISNAAGAAVWVTGSGGSGGATGIQGQTGVGIQGATGIQGVTGLQGQTGVGIQGATGTQGTQGQTGIQGQTGVGVQGATGIQGVTGIQGQTGAGIQGATGIQGVTGIQGQTGAGIQGATGIQGIQGTTGIQGQTGLGLQGATGIQGVTGIQGQTGSGIQGATGIQGVTGIQGQTGAGIQGPTGLQGAGGSAGSQGQTGIQGITGLQGQTGIQGATGLQGQTGIQGVTGLQGQTGIQGQTGLGATGIQGQTGVQGSSGSGSSPNMLINSTFRIWQRLTTSSPSKNYSTGSNGDSYLVDRWKVQYNIPSGTLTYGNGADTSAPGGYALTIKPPTSTATVGYGIIQWLENLDVNLLVGQQVTFSVWIKSAVAAVGMRIAIIEWTGTADGPVTNPVNSWSSGTFTTGNFYKSTTTTIDGQASGNTTAGSYVQYTVTANITTSCKNLGLMIFAPEYTTPASQETISIAGAYLSLGASAPASSAFVPRLANEVELCQRYYELSGSGTSFYDNSSSGLGNGQQYAGCGAASQIVTNSGLYFQRTYKVQKRTGPTVTTYSWSNNTSGSISDSSGNDVTSGGATVIGSNAGNFYLYNTSGGNISSTYGFWKFHWTADCDF